MGEANESIISYEDLLSTALGESGLNLDDLFGNVPGNVLAQATLNTREFKQTRRRRQRERHLKMQLGVAAIISKLFKVITLGKCVLTILELNWNQRFGDSESKLNICHHMLTSSTQLQNRSFHVVKKTRTSAKCPKLKNARAKRAKLLFFIVKNADL